MLVSIDEEGVDVLNLCSLYASKSSRLATLVYTKGASRCCLLEVVGEELVQLVGVEGNVVGVDEESVDVQNVWCSL